MPLPPPLLGDVEREISGLLHEQELCVLSTTRADGSPSTSPMYLAAEGLTAYCHMLGYTRKSGDLRRDPRVAYTLAHLSGDVASRWRNLRMAQVSGRATFITDRAEIEHALQLCAEQFTWLRDPRRRAGFERDGHEGRMTFFRIDPEQCLWHDNRVGTGWRVLVNFTADGRHVSSLAPYGPAPDLTATGRG
jgi:nitroimidazol reductase NimA-like FMN-containing flavoprotein (pyridoxamine 5'-phosphate oxidase superfamily)